MYTHNSVKKYCLACRYCAEISIKNIDERVWLCVERHRRSTTLNSGLNALTKLVRYVLRKDGTTWYILYVYQNLHRSYIQTQKSNIKLELFIYFYQERKIKCLNSCMCYHLQRLDGNNQIYCTLLMCILLQGMRIIVFSLYTLVQFY